MFDSLLVPHRLRRDKFNPAKARAHFSWKYSPARGLAYEFAHTRGGLITQVPVLRSIFGRWRHLTPEFGHLCAAYASQTHKRLMDVCVDYHRPTWYLAWNVETMWRNECPFAFPTMAAEVFAARALILREPAFDTTCVQDLHCLPR